MNNETLEGAFGSHAVTAIQFELSCIGAGRLLFAGRFGSRIKGYSRKGSDHDICLVYSYDEVTAQQVIFKTQEFFDKVADPTSEHKLDLKEGDTEYQFKIISVQHFIAQICASNYCMAQATLNPVWCAESFKTAAMALRFYAEFALDYTTIAQNKYRAAYHMSQSVTESEDRKGAGNRQDRRMAESSSRLLDAAHGFMTSQIIRQATPVGRFVTSDYSKLLEEYRKLPDQPVPADRLEDLLHIHVTHESEEKIFEYVRLYIVPGIIASRPDFDKFGLPRDDDMVTRRRELSKTIYQESLKACLALKK